MNAEKPRRVLTPWSYDSRTAGALFGGARPLRAWVRHAVEDGPPKVVARVEEYVVAPDEDAEDVEEGAVAVSEIRARAWWVDSVGWEHKRDLAGCGDALVTADFGLVHGGWALPGAAREAGDVLDLIRTSWTYRRMVGHAQNQAAVDATKGEG